jgi:hypothetical protein
MTPLGLRAEPGHGRARTVVPMPVHHQTGGQFGKEVRALWREQDTGAGIALNRVDVRKWVGARSRQQGRRPDLDRCEVPTARVAMVSIRQEERLRSQCLLHHMDARGVADAPDLVQASESVCEFDESASGRFQKGPQRTLPVAAPQPQAAQVGFSGMHGRGASGDAVGAGLFMGEDRRIAAVEQPHDPGAYRFASVARKAETLVVHEQRRSGILDRSGASEGSRRFFARHVGQTRKFFRRHGKTISVKGNEDWHLTPARISGAAA